MKLIKWHVYAILFCILASTCFLQAKTSTFQEKWKGKTYNENSRPQLEASLDVLAKLHLTGNERILDVGCGDGKITAYVASKVPLGHILGTDIGPDMIQFAQQAFNQKEYPNLNFKVIDARDITFNQEFDIVVSFFCLHWIAEDNGLQNVIKNIAKSLKPGGKFFALIPTERKHPWRKTFQEISHLTKWQSNFTQVKRLWVLPDKNDMQDMLVQAGLTPLHIEQKNKAVIFETRKKFEQFSLSTATVHHMPDNLRKQFVKERVDRYLESVPLLPDNSLLYNQMTLLVVAQKPVNN